MLFPKGRNIIFPVIFLTGLSFIYASGQAQLSPVPPEGFMAGQASGASVPQASGMLFYLSGDKGFSADIERGIQTSLRLAEDIPITVPDGTDLSKGSVQVDPGGRIIQITRKNTFIKWGE